MSEELFNILKMNKKQQFIYSLMYYPEKSFFFITDLERFLGYKHPQQNLRKVVKLLIEKQIINPEKKIKGDFCYSLNKKLLKNLIRESPLFIKNGEFIEETVEFFRY